MRAGVELSPNNIIVVDLREYGYEIERSFLSRLLEELEMGKADSIQVSDECDERREEILKKLYEELHPIYPTGEYVQVIHRYDEYIESLPNSLGIEVFSVLQTGSSYPIFPEDVPFIREFLNTPKGQEKEAWAKWRAYWDKVDFYQRREELDKILREKYPQFKG